MEPSSATSDLCNTCKLADAAGASDELYQSDRDIPSDLSEEEALRNDDDGVELIEDNSLEDEIWGSSEGEGAENEAPSSSKLLKRVRRDYIRMPTGKKYYISTPKPKNWKCSTNESKFVLMEATGEYAKEYNTVSKEMEKTIVSHPGYTFKGYTIVKMQKVVNGCLWRQFLHRSKEVRTECGYVNQRMLFHGAKTADDISLHGFNEQYSSMNGMFGAGLYFAKHSSKANQYVFNSAVSGGCPTHLDKNCVICERKMLLCRVIMGRTKGELNACQYSHAPVGYHSVTGIPNPGVLKYPEYIIYKREQAYPEILITYKVHT